MNFISLLVKSTYFVLFSKFIFLSSVSCSYSRRSSYSYGGSSGGSGGRGGKSGGGCPNAQGGSGGGCPNARGGCGS